MKKIIVLCSLMSAVLMSRAQQDILISQYMFNHLLVNPGYAGSKDYMMATLLYRSQWVNFKGAPETQLATLHGPWGNTNLGWGGTLMHDHVGVTDRIDGYFDLAYHLRVSENLKLGMGIRAGFAYFSTDFSKLVYWDTDDPTFAGGIQSNVLPNVGAGLFLYSQKFYAGVSCPTVFSYDSTQSISIDAAKKIPHKVRHYYGTMGAALPLNSEVVMRPSILVKYVPNAPLETDLNLHFLFSNLLWVGASYRTGDAIIGMVEFQLTRKFRIGYAYDYTLTDIKDYSAGSHEVMIGYDFGYDIMKIKTPRYF